MMMGSPDASRTFSERLFEEFCIFHKVPIERICEEDTPTPDYRISLDGKRVVCEIKQLDPTPEDLEELNVLSTGTTTGRFVPNRLSKLLKRVSRQLSAASSAAEPTMVVVYDNSPLKMYTDHDMVVSSMFGANSIRVYVPSDPRAGSIVSPPFFGGGRRMTPDTNTSVSAVAVLDGGPTTRPLSLRLYHNPFAKVVLPVLLFAGLPVSHPVEPGTTAIRLG